MGLLSKIKKGAEIIMLVAAVINAATNVKEEAESVFKKTDTN